MGNSDTYAMGNVLNNMDDFLKILGGGGIVGTIWAIVIWLGRSGFIKGRVTIGNEQNGKEKDCPNTEIKADIAKLYDHAKIANDEMGKVQERLGNVETTVARIDGKLDVLIELKK